MSKKLLQINVTANWGSTGKIAEQIGLCAMAKGWESYIAYGRMVNPSKNKLIKIGSQLDVYEHYAESRFLDKEGLASRKSTKKFVQLVEDIKPDIVQLHNIHDHWLNYKILFEYLNQTDIKLVWTFHDFWTITGHCSHFVQVGCSRFQTGCYACPYTKGKLLPLLKRTRRNYNLKNILFSANKNLTIVPVSEWVGNNVKKSFLKDKPIFVIPNGVDTDVFKPTYMDGKYLFDGKFVIMAVSSQWKSNSKGLEDYKAMAKMLQDDEIIVLVGVTDEVSKNFPKNIVGIRRTNNQQELAALYTRADVVCSFSAAETFGLTIIEGNACGTPAVVYNNTAPPSLITAETGFVVPNKDYKSAYHAIEEIRSKGKYAYSEACIRFAQEKYSKDKCFEKYINLYENLIKHKSCIDSL